jgi:hypothetical protein
MMNRRVLPRLPFEPLERWLNTRYTNTDSRADAQLGGHLTARRIAELVGYDANPDTGRLIVQRWRAGGIPLYAADRAAITAGAHPLELWPNFATITSDPPEPVGAQRGE